MTYVWLWVVAGGGLVVALIALSAARGARRRLDQLTHSYWELRYQYGELQAQVNRLDPAHQQPQDAPQSFIPLSSLKR